MNKLTIPAPPIIAFYGLMLLSLVALAVGIRSASSITERQESKASPQSEFSTMIASHAGNAAAGVKQICFLRNEWNSSTKTNRYWIFSYDLSSGKETKLAEGTAPQISRTTGIVAYTGGTVYNDAGGFVTTEGRDDPWRIKIIDPSNSQVRDFKSLETVNAFNPIWSHDGKQLAFQVNVVPTRLDIGVLDPSTEQWRVITNNVDFGNPVEPIFIDSWVPGGRSILFHTLENLYEVDLSGTLLQRLPIRNFGISSATKFSFSSNRKYLLFDGTYDTAEDSIATVFVFDLDSKKTKRITPTTIDASAPVWLPSEGEILFTCQERSESPTPQNLCRIAIDGTRLSTLISDATFASYSIQ